MIAYNKDYRDLFLDSYNFSLPQNLIATSPKYPKESAKLLVYYKDTGEIIHTTFASLFDFIPRDYLIVLNDTKVIPARFYASKLDKPISYDTSISISYLHNKVREFLYHKPVGELRHLVQIRGRVRQNDFFMASDLKTLIRVIRVLDYGYKEVSFYDILSISSVTKHGNPEFTESNICGMSPMSDFQVIGFLRECGKVPIPPYIKREANIKDAVDYQSIFASIDGSVAAPTASLHFSESMFAFLKENFHYTFITLHIGAGTFAPIKTNSILEHRIHSEYCSIADSSAIKIAKHNKILCVGTTALRCIEWFARTSAYEQGLYLEANLNHKCLHNDKSINIGISKDRLVLSKNIEDKQGQDRQIGALCGENSLFLHPFNPPRLANALLTNFHLPKSSLLLLVSSLIGREEVLRVYDNAIRSRYRFYSYGDGMLII